MDPSIIEEDLDSYYIYYNFKTLEYPRFFHHMIKPYEPCIQSFDLSKVNHPFNQTNNTFPLSLFLTKEFYSNPQFTLTGKTDQSIYKNFFPRTFHFRTKTGKHIEKVMQEKLKLFEQNPFPSYEWFTFEEKNPSFKEYITNLLNAGIIEIDKKTFKYVHGPNGWIVKRQKEAAAIKFLEDKINAVLNRINDCTTRDAKLVEITYLISLQRY